MRILLFFLSIALINFAVIAKAESSELVKFVGECSKSKNNKHKAYRINNYGIIQNQTFSIIDGWNNKDRGAGYVHIDGKLKNGEIIIKGEGSYEKSKNQFTFFGKQKSNGNLIEDLKKGIKFKEQPNKKGERDCTARVTANILINDALYVNDLKSKLEKSRKLSETLSSDLSVLKSKHDKLEKTIKNINATSDVSKLNTEIALLKKKLDEKEKASSEDTKTKIDELNLSLMNFKIENDNLKKEIKELENKATSTSQNDDELIAFARKINDLQSEVEKKTKEIAENKVSFQRELTASNNKNEQNLSNQKNKINELENKISQLNSSLSKKDEDIKVLRNAISAIESTPSKENIVCEESKSDDSPVIAYLEKKNKELEAKLENCSPSQTNSTSSSVSTSNEVVEVENDTKSVETTSRKTTVEIDPEIKLLSTSNKDYVKFSFKSYITNNEMGRTEGRLCLIFLDSDGFEVYDWVESFSIGRYKEDTIADKVTVRKNRIKDATKVQIFADDTLCNNYKPEFSNKVELDFSTNTSGNNSTQSNNTTNTTNTSQSSTLPNGKYEVSSYCAGAMTSLMEADYFKQYPQFIRIFEDTLAKHFMKMGQLSNSGQEGTNKMVDGMTSVQNITGGFVNDQMLEEGKPLQKIIIECRKALQ